MVAHCYGPKCGDRVNCACYCSHCCIRAVESTDFRDAEIVRLRAELDAAKRDLEAATQFTVGSWTIYQAVSGKWVAAHDDGCRREYSTTIDEAIRRARELAGKEGTK